MKTTILLLTRLLLPLLLPRLLLTWLLLTLLPPPHDVAVSRCDAAQQQPQAAPVPYQVRRAHAQQGAAALQLHQRDVGEGQVGAVEVVGHQRTRQVAKQGIWQLWQGQLLRLLVLCQGR